MSERLELVVPESAKTPFYPALDGLRTIAVLLVMVTHYLPKRVPFGWMGVQLFFVLSGFLITGILFDTRSTRHRFRNFYVRRALRIFPLYYGLVIVVLLIAFLTHAHILPVYGLWLVYAQNFFWMIDHGRHGDVIMTPGGVRFAVIGHLWSLAVEEQFYLIWPLVVFAVPRRERLMQICAALVVLRLLLAVVWWNALSQNQIDNGVLYRMLPTQSDGFLMGGMLALWLRGQPSAWVRRRSGLLAAGSLTLYTLLLLVLRRYPGATAGDVSDYRSGFQVMAGIPLVNLVSVAGILATIQPRSWLFRICNLAPMRSLGRVSYGIYVYHSTLYLLVAGRLILWCYGHGIPRLAGTAASTAGFLLTLLVAYASFHWYERPFLLLKNRFTAIRNDPQKAAAAHPV